MTSFTDNTPSIFVQSGWDKSQLFGMNSARDVRHFVLRGTGGCGLMSDKDAVGMRNLELALSGRDLDGIQHSKLPRFSGLCLFGGTRMVRKDDPSVVVPGITEVYPAIDKYCDRSAMLGVVVKAAHLRYTKYGLVVAESSDDPWVTIVHPTQTSCVLLQPSADTKGMWDDEYKECLRLADTLREADWKGLLIAYNGGGVTEREIRSWAKLGQRDQFWQVLLIKGSGRKTDELANDEEFLAEHPTVHVCTLDVEDMRTKLQELSAITVPEQKGNP